jgi:hypothetical protein
MKKHTAILLLLLSTAIISAQKKETIKGSKKVTIEQREIENFHSLQVDDNIEVYIERGETAELKIEADDNLHDIIKIDLQDNALRIYTTKEAIRYRKLMVKITYSKDLNLVISRNNVTINAIQQVLLDSITFRSFDNSKLFLNVNVKDFLLQSNDESKVELNLKSENSKIELSKDASLKTLLVTYIKNRLRK